MRSFLASTVVMICWMGSWTGSPAAGAARSPAEVAQEALSHITTKQPYTLNADVAVSLEKGRAIQLDVQSNPYGLEKFVLYYYVQADGSGFIRGDAYLDDGQPNGTGARADFEGMLRQVGRTPCLAIIKWTLRDGCAHLDVCLCDNLERNHGEYRQCKVDGKKMYLSYRDRQLIPELPLEETQRLAGFVRLWSEIKFNFVFWSRIPEVNWDQVLLEYLPKVQAAKTDVQYYRVLQQCVALLRDGHTGVWGTSNEPTCRPPVEIAAVQGKAVIVQVFPGEQIKHPQYQAELRAAQLQRGEEITQIDGRAVERILAEDLYPYIAASTPQQKELVAYPRLANGAFGTKVVLRIRDAKGNERSISLTRRSYDFPREVKPFLRELPGGLVCVHLGSFDDDQVVKQFQGQFDKIRAAQGLILDLRDNGGGSSGIGYSILKMLIDKPAVGSRWRTRQYLPAFRAWGRKEQWYQGDPETIKPSEGPRYGGPVAVLTGPATASAAEDFVVAFQTSARGKVVGRRTLGSTGQPLTIELPGGGGARICTKWDTYPDGREFVGTGCLPDVEVVPTPADIATGRDVVLEKAAALLHP